MYISQPPDPTAMAYDQITGRNEITCKANNCIAQLAPTTAMRKHLDERFLVLMMAPGLTAHDVDAKLTRITDGDRPVLAISSKGARRGSDVVCSYQPFQQYVLLPGDVVLESFKRESSEGLFVFSFDKRRPDVILGVQ